MLLGAQAETRKIMRMNIREKSFIIAPDYTESCKTSLSANSQTIYSYDFRLICEMVNSCNASLSIVIPKPCPFGTLIVLS